MSIQRLEKFCDKYDLVADLDYSTGEYVWCIQLRQMFALEDGLAYVKDCPNFDNAVSYAIEYAIENIKEEHGIIWSEDE